MLLLNKGGVELGYFDIWYLIFRGCDIYLAPGGGWEVLFSPGLSVYLCVFLCVRPIFWYFISQLLVEISIWNSHRTLIGSYSIHWKKIDLHRSMVKVTGTVHCFLKVQSYHKNWAIEKFQYFFVDTSLYALSNETIQTWASREMTSQKIRRLTCKTPIPQLILLIKSSKKI